ncbi:MAG TPA: MFS transporter, partial [Candidatus Limnocylindria bacterium]|nr:MFS transporter [Candidatus Limnocylindria bacterium]
LATALPAGLSVIPRLVERARHGLALAIGGSSHNLALVVMPPLSVAVLGAVGFDGVHLVIGGVVVAGLATILARPVRPLPTPVEGLATARRRLGFAYRADWTAPLAIMVLSVANWGVISAYLPQRADAVNADIGLFFAAAGAGILLGRIPSGWLADRLPPLWPILAGVTVTVVGMLLLLVPPTTALLVVAGALSGGGTALIVTPLLLVLSRRSNEADRGSAFGLFAGSFALAIAIGSVGVAPVIERAGFELAMVAMLVALGLSGVVALFDRGLRGQERDRTAGAASAAELPPIEP